MCNYIPQYNYGSNSNSFLNMTSTLKKDNIEELKNYSENNIQFGTGGIRAKMGLGPGRINEHTILKITQGLANYLIKQKLTGNRIVIAYDTRKNSQYYAKLTAMCLNRNRIKTFLFKESTPTPVLSYTIRKLNCIAGIVITASHNDFRYNGYKMYWSDGGQITNTLAEALSKEIQKITFLDLSAYHDRKPLDKTFNELIGEQIKCSYISEMLKLCTYKNFNILNNISVVYTPLYGTGIKFVPSLIKQMGVKKLFIVYDQIDRTNQLSVKTPNPSIKGAFSKALKLGQKKNVDVIIATDADTDRLGLMARIKKNRYKFFNGNMLGVFLLNYILEQRQNKRNVIKKGIVIKTIVSSRLIDRIAKTFNVEVITVLTGFKYIGEQIKHYEINEQQFVLGVEESNGYLIETCVRDKDAISAAMLACEACAFYKAKGISIWEQMHSLYKKYGFYKEGIIYRNLSSLKEADKIMNFLRNKSNGFAQKNNILKIDDYMIGKSYDVVNDTVNIIKHPKTNMLLFDMGADNWFAIRPSGTELKLKIYFGVRGTSLKEANSSYKYQKELISNLIENQ